MEAIKCICGNKGCTTKVRINFTGTKAIDLQIEHTEKDSTEKYETVMLDPNAIVDLISKLKQALQDLA